MGTPPESRCLALQGGKVTLTTLRAAVIGNSPAAAMLGDSSLDGNSSPDSPLAVDGPQTSCLDGLCRQPDNPLA
jgi:hypothetical protein